MTMCCMFALSNRQLLHNPPPTLSATYNWKKRRFTRIDDADKESEEKAVEYNKEQKKRKNTKEDKEGEVRPPAKKVAQIFTLKHLSLSIYIYIYVCVLQGWIDCGQV